MTNETANKKVKVGDILVSTWGYSMRLATFVKVEKVSAKTLVVREVILREASDEERKAAGLGEPGYLQSYSMPTNQVTQEIDWEGEMVGFTRPTKDVATIRLYPNSSNGWFTRKDGYKKSFDLWDGRPVYENHCD